jgi:hypothetical protein
VIQKSKASLADTALPTRANLTGSGRPAVVVGRPSWFGGVPARIALAVIWVAILISEGPIQALKYSWLLVPAAYLGAYVPEEASR